MRYVYALVVLLLCPVPSFASDIQQEERSIFDSFMKGADLEFAEKVSAYVLQYPDRPESHFYVRDLFNTARYTGYNSAIETFLSLEKRMSGKTDPASQILRRRAVSFLDELEFSARRGNGNRFTEYYKPVIRWNMSSPLRRYGPGDLVHRWEPEFNSAKHHAADAKPFTVRERRGRVYPERFVYPSKGISFATSLLSLKKPAIIRVESNSEYQLFINGVIALDNREGGVCRNARSVKITGIETALLMMKTVLSDDAFFRVTIMNTDWTPLEPVYAKLPSGAAGSFAELDEPPFSGLSAEYETAKSAEAALHLAWYYSEYDDIRALEWYEKSLSLHEDSAVRAIYASECGRLGSQYNYPSLEAKEREEFSRLFRKDPQCVPARNAALRDIFRYEDRVRASRTAFDQISRGNSDYDCLDSICSYFSENGDWASLSEAASAFGKKFPLSALPQKFLAKSLESKNPEEAYMVYRRILEKTRDEQIAVKAANLARKSGQGIGEKLLIEYIDDQTAPSAYTSATLLIDGGQYESAKRLLLSMAAIKDDPRIYESLGRMKILSGSTPDMFWEKTAGLESASRFPLDYLSFKTNGRAAPLLDRYRRKDRVELLEKDFLSEKKFESAVLLRSSVQKINADRSGRYFYEEIIYIRDNHDVERYGEYRVPFDKNLSVINCSVLHRDGSRDGSYAAHDVDGEKFLTVTGLAPDVLLHVSYEVDNYSPVLSLSSLVCSDSIFMHSYDEPVEEYISTIAVPSGLPLSVSYSPGVIAVSAADGDETIWTIRAEHLPPVHHEPHGVGPERVLGWYAYTECGTVEEFAEWYRGLWPAAGHISLPIPAAGSREETIRKVYSYISQTITQEEGGLFSPDKVTEVIFKGKGSPEDKVFCAKQILADHGIVSYPALVMRKGLPSGTVRPDQFSSVVLYIPGGGGTCLDFSRQYYPAGALSPETENAELFVLSDNGTVSRTIARSAVRPDEKYDGELKLGENGEAVFSLNAFFSGRNVFIEKYSGDNRFRDELIGVVAGVFHRNAVVTAASFPENNNYGQAALSLRGTVPAFSLSGNNTISFKPFFHPTELPGYLGGEARLSPLVISEEISTQEKFRILLPSGYEKESLQVEKTAVFGSGTVTCRVTKVSGSPDVVVERVIRFPECEVETESYGDFLRFCAELRSIEQMRVTFSRKK